MISNLSITLLLACGLCEATTLVATVDPARGESNLWFNEHGANGGATQAYFAGVLFLDLNANGSDYYRDTLCVDLYTNLVVGQPYGTNVVTPDSLPGHNLNRVSWLVDNALLPTQNASFLSTLDKPDWVASPAQGAGIQLAIWDLVVDGGDGFSAGQVEASSDTNNPTDPDVLKWANFYEDQSAGKSSDLAFVYETFSLGNGLPAQILAGSEFQDNGPQPAPEPSTEAFGGSALLLLAYLARRKRPHC
jgi:hypothetical protein